MTDARRWRETAKAFFSIVFLLCAPFLVSAQTLDGPDRIRQGDPLLCWIASPTPLGESEAKLISPAGKVLYRAKPFYYSPLDGDALYGVLVPINFKYAAGDYSFVVEGDTVTAEGSKPFRLEKTVVVEMVEFPFEVISLDKSNTDILTVPDPAKVAQAESFAEVFAAGDPTSIFLESEIVRPLAQWRVTAPFAEGREYKFYNGKSERSYHGGIDLGAKTGTEVAACAPGRVVFEGLRIVTGNTIVLEHLPGLFTIYMHLSKFDVAEGDVVAMGQKIGEVGATGLATGPHLHWEMRIGLVSVNPEYWVTNPPLDKEAIIRKTSSAIEGR